MVREQFGWNQAVAHFTEICENAVQRRRSCAENTHVHSARLVRAGLETECD